MENYEIIFYDKPDGTEPAKEFLLSLDHKMRAKMLRTIDLLEANGIELREPYSKALEDGIFELHAKVGSDISRVLYFFLVGKKDLPVEAVFVVFRSRDGLIFFYSSCLDTADGINLNRSFFILYFWPDVQALPFAIVGSLKFFLIWSQIRA